MITATSRLALAIVLLSLTAPAWGGVAAPWIFGHGYATNPGTTVCVVDNLSNDDQLKTCAALGNRVVTFKSCGTITCDTTVPRITVASGTWIAGNTCPEDGGGITLYGCAFSMVDRATDVIFTGLQMYEGTHYYNGPAGTLYTGGDANLCSQYPAQLQGAYTDRVVIAHNTLSRGGDKVISLLEYGTDDISILHNIFDAAHRDPAVVGGCDGCNSLGVIVGNNANTEPAWCSGGFCVDGPLSGEACPGGYTECEARCVGGFCVDGARDGEACDHEHFCQQGRLTMYGNLFANYQARMPLVHNANHLDLVNNVMYNWGDGATFVGNLIHYSDSYKQDASHVNMNAVGNVYLHGPSAMPGITLWSVGGIKTQVYEDDNWGTHCGYAYGENESQHTCDENASVNWASSSVEEIAYGTQGTSIDAVPESWPTSDYFGNCALPSENRCTSVGEVTGGLGTLADNCLGEPLADCRDGVNGTCCWPKGYSLEHKYKRTTSIPAGSGREIPTTLPASSVVAYVEANAGPISHALPAVSQEPLDELAANTGDMNKFPGWGICAASKGLHFGNQPTGGCSGQGSCCNEATLNVRNAEKCLIDTDCATVGHECYGICTIKNSEYVDTYGADIVTCVTCADCSGGCATRSCIFPSPSVAPTITAGTTWADTDSDGMDDAWETTKFGDLSKGAATSVTVSGWTGPALHYFAWSAFQTTPNYGDEEGVNLLGATVTGGSIQ